MGVWYDDFYNILQSFFHIYVRRKSYALLLFTIFYLKGKFHTFLLFYFAENQTQIKVCSGFDHSHATSIPFSAMIWPTTKFAWRLRKENVSNPINNGCLSFFTFWGKIDLRICAHFPILVHFILCIFDLGRKGFVSIIHISCSPSSRCLNLNWWESFNLII